MELVEFIESCDGKWFSQRTSYRLGQAESWHQSDKGDLFVDFLATDDAAVQQICQAAGLDPSQALAGLRSRWNDSLIRQSGSSLIVLLKESTREIGILLLQGRPGQAPQQGRFQFLPNQSLTLVMEDGQHYAEERIWFAHPNLRLRTSLMRDKTVEFSRSSFYSEIRMGVKPPTPQ
jgi:phycoerythrin-associated linker protein